MKFAAATVLVILMLAFSLVGIWSLFVAFGRIVTLHWIKATGSLIIMLVSFGLAYACGRGANQVMADEQ